MNGTTLSATPVVSAPFASRTSTVHLLTPLIGGSWSLSSSLTEMPGASFVSPATYVSPRVSREQSDVVGVVIGSGIVGSPPHAVAAAIINNTPEHRNALISGERR